jgi:hypothetical protein
VRYTSTVPSGTVSTGENSTTVSTGTVSTGTENNGTGTDDQLESEEAAFNEQVNRSDEADPMGM